MFNDARVAPSRGPVYPSTIGTYTRSPAARSAVTALKDRRGVQKNRSLPALSRTVRVYRAYSPNSTTVYTTGSK